MSDKLTVFPGGGKPDAMKQAVRELKSALPEFIQYQLLIAEITKAKYDALLKQGFTPEQALELSKNPLNT